MVCVRFFNVFLVVAFSVFKDCFVTVACNWLGFKAFF